MDRELITDRKVEKIIADIASARSIQHDVLSDGWVHVLAKENKRARLIGYKWSLNDAAASGIASDKVATYQVLEAASIEAVPHILLRTKADFRPHWPEVIPEMFVLKPLNGTSAHGVTLCDSKEMAANIIGERKISAWALSPKLIIEREVRVIILDGEVLLGYEKYPSGNDELPFFNLGKGATAEVISLTDEMRTLAFDAMRAIGLRLAAVDIVWADGRWQVLEVNDGLMMEHFLRQSDEYYSLAVGVYEKIIDAAFYG